MSQAPEAPPFPIKETGDWAGASLSPPRHRGETRLRQEALQVCGGADAALG